MHKVRWGRVIAITVYTALVVMLYTALGTGVWWLLVVPAWKATFG